jgi:hypothetical protein
MKVKDAMHKGVDWFSPDIRNVELGRYGKALIGPLRKAYGSFAPHCADDERLSDVLHKLDEASLTLLIRDHVAGKLKRICQR